MTTSDPVPRGTGKVLKPIKTKMRFKKDDYCQCRLCLRMLPRSDFPHHPADDDESEVQDFRRKISEAVGVQITDIDWIKTVCCSCRLLVNVINQFRESCSKADTIHRTKLLKMHPGSWTSNESKAILEDCNNLMKRHWVEMDGLFKFFERKNRENQQRVERGALRKSADTPSMMDPLDGALFDDDDEELEDTLLQPIPQTPTPQPSTAMEKNVAICDVCGISMEPHLFQQHRNRHLGIRPYVCSYQGCDKAFFSRRVLREHFRVVHIATMLECPICQRKLKGKALLKRHMLVHNGPQQNNPRKSACPVCGKMFYKSYLKDHMAVHTGMLAYPCGICDRRFAAMNNRITHWKKVHPDVEHPGKMFQQQGNNYLLKDD